MEQCELTKRKTFLKALIILCMFLNAVAAQNVGGKLTACEIDSLLQQLSTPRGEFELHASALRSQLRDLLDKLENGAYRQTTTNNVNKNLEEEIPGNTLAHNDFFQNNKRYVGSLARSGLLRSQYDDIKRSIATLAKNGQLPSREPEVDDSSVQTWEGKRNAAILRSDFSAGKRNIAALARDRQLSGFGKRNLPSILKFGYTPTSKKNIASLARVSMLPFYTEKRNIGAMARDWSLPNLQTKLNDAMFNEVKRNIGALKNSLVHGIRQKRELIDDIFGDFSAETTNGAIEPSNLVDYGDLKEVMNHIEPLFDTNIQEEKRFLEASEDTSYNPPNNKRNIGSLARLGLLRSDMSRFGFRKINSYRQQEQKRHIGALARSGWLPAFRPSRSGRFSRSGRARSRIVGYYPQPERLRQPIAGVCRRCDENQLQSNFNWGASALPSTWGTPPRLTALHWRSLRPTGHFY